MSYKHMVSRSGVTSLQFNLPTGICPCLGFLHDVLALASLPLSLASLAMSILLKFHLKSVAGTWTMLRGKFKKKKFRSLLERNSAPHPPPETAKKSAASLMGKPKAEVS